MVDKEGHLADQDLSVHYLLKSMEVGMRGVQSSVKAFPQDRPLCCTVILKTVPPQINHPLLKLIKTAFPLTKFIFLTSTANTQAERMSV